MKKFVECDSAEMCLEAFKQFFDASPFPVSISEVSAEDEPTVYINPAFTALTGYDFADIVGKNCRILQGQQERQAGSAMIRSAIRKREVAQTELLNYRKDGSSFWNFVRVMPLDTQCTDRQYMLGFQIDITAVVNPRVALEYAVQTEAMQKRYALHQERLLAIGNMAAGMAHEINNPIAGIMMNVEYLLSSQVSQEETQVVLEESFQELKRVSRLIKSMLGFSRKSDKNIDQMCRLRSILDETLVIVEPLLKTASVTLHYDADNPALERQLYLDPDALKQVLLNLVTNAVQAMEKVSQLKRRLSIDCVLLLEQNQAVVSISDTGIGVPKAIKDKIFDPFFTTKPQGEGTGLGLSLSAKLVQDVGGVLSLDETYQQGAKFLLYLPLYQVQNATKNSIAYAGSLSKSLEGGVISI